jgi:hypothetical protein
MTDEKPREPEAAPPRPEYEPPKLERVGNLRDLVGKTGGAGDKAKPHIIKP